MKEIFQTNVAFINDVLQIFINCEAYNLEEAEVYKEGKRLLGIFMGLLDNYSMSSLLNPQEFRWLEEVIRSKCTKCRMDFPHGIKKVSKLASSISSCRAPFGSGGEPSEGYSHRKQK